MAHETIMPLRYFADHFIGLQLLESFNGEDYIDILISIGMVIIIMGDHEGIDWMSRIDDAK